LVTVSLLLAVAAIGAGAQNSTIPEGGGGRLMGPSGLAIGLEGSLHSQADELVSPLRYHGTGLGPTLRIGFSVPSQIRSLTFGYGNPRLTSRATSGMGQHETGPRVGLAILLMHRVASLFRGRVSLFLGGSVTGHLATYDHWYTEEEKEHWVHFFGLLEPGVGWRATLPGGGVIWQELTVPLAGAVVRPPYQGLTETPDPAWVGPGAVEGFTQGLHYLHPLFGGFRLGLTYGFVGLRYGNPRPLAWTRQNLALFLTVWDRRKPG
jgi:hypothetical protein